MMYKINLDVIIKRIAYLILSFLKCGNLTQLANFRFGLVKCFNDIVKFHLHN